MVDDAAAYFGGWVEGKMSETHKSGPKKGKPKHRLEKLLGMEQPARKLTRQDVAAWLGESVDSVFGEAG